MSLAQLRCTLILFWRQRDRRPKLIESSRVWKLQYGQHTRLKMARSSSFDSLGQAQHVRTALLARQSATIYEDLLARRRLINQHLKNMGSCGTHAAFDACMWDISSDGPCANIDGRLIASCAGHAIAWVSYQWIDGALVDSNLIDRSLQRRRLDGT